MTDPQTIYIDFCDPDATEVKDSLKYKILLRNRCLEYFTKNIVSAKDEDSGLQKEWNIDTRLTMIKSHIEGIETFRANRFPDKNIYGLRLTVKSGELTIFFEKKYKALEVHEQILNWITNS